MSEGGRFPWKIQKIFSVPVGRYERLRESLPKPPEGMAWWQNKETREWKLIPEEELAALEQPLQQPKAENSEVTVDFEGDREAFANPFGVPEKVTAVNQEDEEEPATTTIATATAVLQALASTRPTTQQVYVQQGEEEAVQIFMNNLPPASEDSKSEEADWELLSDRQSLSHSGSNSVSTPHHHNTSTKGVDGMAFVSRTGSVSSHSFTASYKLQRTPSSSTIDSHDHYTNLGPTGKGVLGVDYVEHVILPDDTLQGICLAYKISASRLKRANHFSGETLLLAPKKLVIPISKQALRQGYLRVQDTDSKEYKLHALVSEFPQLGRTEAKAYLELADWILKDAIASAREDFEWESNLPDGNKLRAGQIRVMMNVEPADASKSKGGGSIWNFAAQGAGYSPSRRHRHSPEEEKSSDIIKPIDPQRVQAKALQVEDIHAVAPQHNSVGVEMQSFSRK